MCAKLRGDIPCGPLPLPSPRPFENDHTRARHVVVRVRLCVRGHHMELRARRDTRQGEKERHYRGRARRARARARDSNLAQGCAPMRKRTLSRSVRGTEVRTEDRSGAARAREEEKIKLSFSREEPLADLPILAEKCLAVI